MKLEEQIYKAWQSTELSGEKLKAVILDPSMFGVVNVKGERIESMASDWKRTFGAATNVLRGNNDRISGWRLMREMVDWLGDTKDNMISPPRLKVFKTCPNLARTLPGMISDKRNQEDINTDGEDHAVDAARYGLSFAFQGRGQQGLRKNVYIKAGRIVTR